MAKKWPLPDNRKMHRQGLAWSGQFLDVMHVGKDMAIRPAYPGVFCNAGVNATGRLETIGAKIPFGQNVYPTNKVGGGVVR